MKSSSTLNLKWINMDEQLKFKLAERATNDQQLNALVAWLKGQDDWQTAKQITKALGLSDRIIRNLASQSGGKIISGPGCPGYKHIDRATREEVAGAIARMDHQARAMLIRSRSIERQYHRLSLRLKP